MKLCEKVLVWLIAITIVFAVFPVCGYADTDGTEIQIADQPDRLILQLGSQWAGVQFQLKTDDGVYPAPVVVNSSGILKMDLGGSKTYTLSCLASAVTLPKPEQIAESPTSVVIMPPIKTISEVEVGIVKAGIPTIYLILFMIGFLTAVVCIVELCFYIRRKKAESHDDGDDF